MNSTGPDGVQPASFSDSSTTSCRGENASVKPNLCIEPGEPAALITRATGVARAIPDESSVLQRPPRPLRWLECGIKASTPWVVLCGARHGVVEYSKPEPIPGRLLNLACNESRPFLPATALFVVDVRCDMLLRSGFVDPKITTASDIAHWISTFVFVPPPLLELRINGRVWRCCEYLDVFVQTHAVDTTRRIRVQCRIMQSSWNPWYSTVSLIARGFTKARSRVTYVLKPEVRNTMETRQPWSRHWLSCERNDHNPLLRSYTIPCLCSEITWQFVNEVGSARPETINHWNICLTNNNDGFCVPCCICVEKKVGRHNPTKSGAVTVVVTIVPRQSLRPGKHTLIINPSWVQSTTRAIKLNKISRATFPETRIRLVVV